MTSVILTFVTTTLTIDNDIVTNFDIDRFFDRDTTIIISVYS